MLCYNDAWFMDESMVFYLSTNTFSNPIFDALQGEPSPARSSVSSRSNLNATTSTTNNSNTNSLLQNGDRGKQETSPKNDSGDCSASETNTSRPSGSSTRATSWAHKRWASFCDSLVFSVKSKVFVMELNFKLKLRRLRRFAAAWGLGGGSASDLVATSGRAGANGGHLYREEQDDYEPALGSGEPEWPGLSSAGEAGGGGSGRTSIGGNSATRHGGFYQEQPGSGRSRSRSRKSEQVFWKNVVGPHSRESFDRQQEKILYRLEKVVRAKRNSQQLFNMTRPGLNDGLPFVRLVGAKQATSLSSASYAAAAAAAAAAAGASMEQAKVASGSGGIASPPMQHTGYKVPTPPAPRANTKRKSRWMSAVGARKHVASSASSSSAAADSAESVLCIICYTNPPNILTLPCRHHEICSDCFIEIIYIAVKCSKYPLRCVLCRQKVERIGCSRKLLLSVIEKNRTLP